MMKKVIALVLTLILVVSLAATPALAAGNNIVASDYTGTYLLIENEKIEIGQSMLVPDRAIKFYLVISEETGIFLQYGDFLSRVDDYVYLGDDLYVSIQDVVEAFDAFDAVNDCVNYFMSASRFEIAE